MKILKLTVKLDAYIKADCDRDQAIDLAVNAVEVKSSRQDVQLEVETIEVEEQDQ